MAFTEIFVDPSIAADSGVGTIGNPYGDLEFAIVQETLDTVNGTRINVKEGTDEILAASLQTALADTSVSIAWVSTETGPLVFQGYTAAVEDGGIGGISGGGSVGIMTDATLDYVHFLDMHLHTCGTEKVLDLNDVCSVIRCEIDNTTNDGIGVDNSPIIIECFVHNCGGIGIQLGGSHSFAAFNNLENGTNDFTTAISLQSGTIYRNIIKIDGASDGIFHGQDGIIMNNSIWSNGGTGHGIIGAGNQVSGVVINNLVEGFSGVNGVGFDFSSSGTSIRVYGGNSAFDNATEFDAPAGWLLDALGGASSNEILSESPFTSASTGDFSPVDTGSVKEGSLPQDFGNGQ